MGKLNEAIESLPTRAGLAYPRAQFPSWALTQNNLGLATRTQGAMVVGAGGWAETKTGRSRPSGRPSPSALATLSPWIGP